MKSISPPLLRRPINVLRRQSPSNGIPVTARERQKVVTRENHNLRRGEYVYSVSSSTRMFSNYLLP